MSKRYSVRVQIRKTSGGGGGHDLAYTIMGVNSDYEAKNEAISKAKSQKPGYDTYTVIQVTELS